MHFIERMTYDMSETCAECSKPIEPKRFGRRQRYCSPRCRTKAHRQLPTDYRPDEISAISPKSPIEIIGELDRLSLQSRRTAIKSHHPSAKYQKGGKSPVTTFVTRVRHPKAVPDAIYPGMWRVQWPDGRLSDMVNLSRANDAISDFLERAAKTQRERRPTE